jgi:lipopolysaccharide transport system ATP-binding protein
MFAYLKKWLSRGASALTDGNPPSLAPYMNKSAPAMIPADEPTVFHLTHWKAGSQWINKILQRLIFERLVLPVDGEQTQFLQWPIQAGKVYPTLYLTKDQFDGVAVPANHRRFVIIRDLRDTLVSLYFSVKASHYLPDDMGWVRAALCERDQEAGLLHTLDLHLPKCAAIQASWLRAGEPLLRYEDLLDNDLTILQRVLLVHCELRVPLQRFQEVVQACRFESITGGRPRGQEDITAHERKGICGDWRNYFTERVSAAFKERYGALLIATGYEADFDWHARLVRKSSDAA